MKRTGCLASSKADRTAAAPGYDLEYGEASSSADSPFHTGTRARRQQLGDTVHNNGTQGGRTDMPKPQLVQQHQIAASIAQTLWDMFCEGLTP